MKFSHAQLLGFKLCLALCILESSSNSYGAPVKTAASAPSAKTNAAPAELVISPAIFDLTVKGIKDPFFPLTQRVPIPATTITTNAPNISAASFQLKGLSGSLDRRLAMINNRTLAIGEASEVTTAGGNKINIRCVDIKDSSVIIRVAGQAEPIELNLRKEAR
jgi:hypothetical protein